MDIADARAHRCLKYLDAVSKRGYQLTFDEFQRYANRPVRGRSFPSINPMESLNLSRETVAGYFYRLGWVDIPGPDEHEFLGDDPVILTDLGRVVLAALDDESLDSEIDAAIVLDQDDPIAHARVIGEIAALGEAAVVDPFFNVQELIDVVQRTQVTRILTGTNDKNGRLAALKQALIDNTFSRDVEIRVSNDFHDRFAIPKSGPVRMLGTSLNGVGKRLSVLIEMQEGTASDSIRGAFERTWKSADQLAPDGPDPGSNSGSTQSTRPDSLDLPPDSSSRAKNADSVDIQAPVESADQR